MTLTLHTVLIILAALLMALAAFEVGSPRVNLFFLGWALAVVSVIVP